VSFVYDEVVLETPVLKGFPLFDIDQVEVLRGPQGTLFGRNTPAGVLKFDSAKPTSTLQRLRPGLLRHLSTINAEGAVSGPDLGDQLAFRLSGLYQHRDDWVDNLRLRDSNDSRATTSSPSAAAPVDANEAFSALLNLHYQHLDGTPQIFRANIIQKGTNDFVPGFKRDEIAQDAEPRAVQKIESSGANLKLTYDFGGPVLTSITAYERLDAYSRGDIDGGFGAVFAPPSARVHPLPVGKRRRRAVPRPVHPGSPGRRRLRPAQLHRGRVLLPRVDQDRQLRLQHPRGRGAGRLRLPEPEDRILGAVRQPRLQASATSSISAAASATRTTPRSSWPSGAVAVRRAADADPAASPDSTNVSFNLNATYAATDDVNLYARVASGYRAPSIQGRLLFGDTISVATRRRSCPTRPA
jgi:iron complex outermembrane receptor protein